MVAEAKEAATSDSTTGKKAGKKKKRGKKKKKKRKVKKATVSGDAVTSGDGDEEAPASDKHVPSDVLSALGEEESAMCSSCEVVAGKLWESLDYAFMKSFQKWPAGAGRLQKTRSVMGKACKAIGDLQVSRVGTEGERRYDVFQAMMQKGGSMSNLMMQKEFSTTLMNVCNKLIQGPMGETLITEMEAHVVEKKKRLFDFKLQEKVCGAEMLNACKSKEKKRKGKRRTEGGDDDDDDEEEDEDNEHDEL